MTDLETGRQHGWRGLVATWSAAAWIVMRQFGVPEPTATIGETRIVRSEPVSQSPDEREMLPDGRVITIPVEVTTGQDDRNRDVGPAQRHWISLN